ncbi:MAG TPA: peptidoglycan-binding protein [Candidatus Paceibacterota bacterium]|nr:peptidoglycan-binding protein [Candidatus Paceibacterota bacterium]
MENFKFFIFSIFILGLIGFAGYWAFTTMESGSTHVDSQKQQDLEDSNEELEKEVTELKRQISLLQLEIEQGKGNEEAPVVAGSNTNAPVVNPTTTPTTTTTPTVSKNQTLINELQKLVDANVYLKLKSQGPAVGTVQKFLNLYNKTSNKVDNDYGPSTVTAVKNYQKANGLTADGEAGVNTFKKMISWLKTH